MMKKDSVGRSIPIANAFLALRGAVYCTMLF